MKKKYIIITIFLIAAAGSIYLAYSGARKTPAAETQCSVKQITFYYLDGCEWCNRVKSEGTIQKIEALGIQVKKINAAIGPIRDKFEGVPTFVINGKVYTGYKTFNEIRELLSCPLETNQK